MQHFSVFQLPDGRWRATARVADARTGGKAPKSIERKTEKAVRDAMKRWLVEFEATIPRKGMTVEAMLNQYLTRCEQKGRAASTIRNYRADAQKWIDAFGHLPITELEAYQIEGVLNEMPTKAGINARSLLRAAINKIARKADPKLANVAELAEAKSYTRKPLAALTWAQFITILDKEKDAALRAQWLLLGFTGVRPEEARSLEWAEIYSRGKAGYWIVLAASKTEEGKKAIALPEEVALAIMELPKASKYVWPGKIKNQPFGETYWRDRWAEACVRAEVKGANLYSIRHLYASYMANKVAPHILKRLLRHTSERTTMQYYVEAFPDDLRIAADGMMSFAKTPQKPHKTHTGKGGKRG